MIGVLIGDISLDFSAELMAGITDAAMQAAVQVVFLLGMQKHSARVAPGVSDAVSRNSVHDYASLAGADALIIALSSLADFSKDQSNMQCPDHLSRLPHVVLQERIEVDSPKKTYIVVDNYGSFTRCLEHLIVDHGYRKIALVAGPDSHADARVRLDAYLDYMRKHNLPVTPGMIASGDFSEYVDDLVSKLIDANPGLEAIAFANDEMAKAGYRECHRRGIEIGRDLAITGFDNMPSSRAMEPPLTTVSQDAYRMGRLALEQAVRLIEGKEAKPVEMETTFVPRTSCGCIRKSVCLPPTSTDTDDMESFLDSVVTEIIDGVVSHVAHDEREQNVALLRDCFNHLRMTALDHPSEPADFQALAGYLNDFSGRYRQSVLLLTQCLEEFMRQFLEVQRPSPASRKFAASVSYMQHFLGMRDIRLLGEQFENYRAQSWFASELTRGLFGDINETDVFYNVAERLMTAGFRHVYICLADKPQRCGGMGLTPVPEKLRLAIMVNHPDTIAYPRAQMPVIDAEHPLKSLPRFQEIPTVMGFGIFSGEIQYGILLCETDKSKNALLQVVGLQLGMLMDFLELRQKEKAIAGELEDIREKNEILNFLSEYDPMSGLLNRRGFIERAIRLNRENIGKTAYCAFMDLDNLKQINDTFGHPEGDIAICAIAGILLNITKECGLIARIGGDEFAGLFLTDDPKFEERFLRRLKKECDRYNAKAGKPYLACVSTGIARFTCRQGLEISAIIAEADKGLYRAKRSRPNSPLRPKPLLAAPQGGAGATTHARH